MGGPVYRRSSGPLMPNLSLGPPDSPSPPLDLGSPCRRTSITGCTPYTRPAAPRRSRRSSTTWTGDLYAPVSGRLTDILITAPAGSRTVTVAFNRVLDGRRKFTKSTTVGLPMPTDAEWAADAAAFVKRATQLHLEALSAVATYALCSRMAVDEDDAAAYAVTEYAARLPLAGGMSPVTIAEVAAATDGTADIPFGAWYTESADWMIDQARKTLTVHRDRPAHFDAPTLAVTTVDSERSCAAAYRSQYAQVLPFRRDTSVDRFDEQSPWASRQVAM